MENNLPKHAQEIYKEARNSAEEQYGEEDRAHRVAWRAVEQKYEKNEMGEWVSKEDRYRPAGLPHGGFAKSEKAGVPSCGCLLFSRTPRRVRGGAHGYPNL